MYQLLAPGDHPREYGENLNCVHIEIDPSGSSPRIRGEFYRGPLLGEPRGIIPANTGRMPCQSKIAFSRRGSSPRIRGK